MILGIGTDLIDIRRIEQTLDRFGGRFLVRVYTEHERARCDARPNRIERYAQRYAAKEACAKALGTGFRQGVAWRCIEVDNFASGKPYLRLYGGALARLKTLTPSGMRSQIELSLTDEYPMAHAMVLIAAVPLPPGATLDNGDLAVD